MGIRLGGLNREVIAISKGPKNSLATSATVEPVLGEDGIAPDVEKIDRHWLAVILEDKPLWKGALISVPAQGKMILFRINSVEPPVSIGTMLTKISLLDERNDPVKKAVTSNLLSFAVTILFKDRAPDYQTLSNILVSKGFAVEKEGKAIGFLATRGTDLDLMRMPNLDNRIVSPPALQLGGISVQSEFSDPVGRAIHIHSRHIISSEESEKILQDLQRAIPLVEDALLKDLQVENDIESMELRVSYCVKTDRDSRPVLRKIQKLPDAPEIIQLSGRKEGDRRLILTAMASHQDRSLITKGLIEITIDSENAINMQAGYIVGFRYGLNDLASAVRLSLGSAGKAVIIIKILEESVSA